MGNCLFGGMGDGGGGGGDESSLIKVTTANGGVMEFSAPVWAETITDEFPGHGIFRSRDLFWKPLPHSDALQPGESYRLLPLGGKERPAAGGHVRSSSAPQPQPYRMSVGKEEAAGGFWKVKLVITAEQLVEILKEEGRTEELIESVRTVAKCGSAFGGFSDHWSLSSSRSRSRNAASAAAAAAAALLDF